MTRKSVRIKISEDITLILKPVCSRIISRETDEPIYLLAHEVEALKRALNDNFHLNDDQYVRLGELDE